MHAYHPGWQCRANKGCINIEISGSDLVVAPVLASEVMLLRKLVHQYAPDGQNFMTTPFWPGAYPLFEHKSPMWAIYALWPRDDEFQQKEIERVKNADPRFVIILDLPLDGRDELRFKYTNPLIYQYILDHFERRPDSPNNNYQIYLAKEVKP